MKYRNDIKFYIKAGTLISTKRFDDSIFNEGESVYEVIRIEDGVPLFANDHLHRLQNSLTLVYDQFICSFDVLRDELNMIIEANGTKEGNIKIELRQDGDSFLRLFYFVPHRYPSNIQLRDGIRMQLQYDERTLPNAKISNWEVRGNANAIIDENQIYETLLVNSDGFITEGSRSNIFFIKNGTLLSPPEDWILPGITRMKVIENCKKLNIPIEFKKIHFSELSSYEAAFITGTSPGVLAVNHIEQHTFSAKSKLIEIIRDSYQNIVTNEIALLK